MKIAASLRIALLIVALSTLASVVRSTPDAAPRTAAFAVHEWGTFTSIQGSDGNPIPWNPFSTASDLPGFVFDRRNPTHNRDVLAGKGAAFLLLGLKDGRPWLQRMETPVIYFHSDKPLTVDVHVRFPDGVLTEWFPQVSGFGPAPAIAGVLPGSSDSHLRWNSVRVVPGGTRAAAPSDTPLPGDSRPSHYFAARSGSDAIAEATQPFAPEVAPQRDRFLFYRGAGDFAAPLRAGVDPDDRTLRLSNLGPEPIGPLFIVRVRKGATAFDSISSLAAGREASVPIPEVAEPSGAGTLGAAMRDSLTRAGLHRAEADAMIQTWNESWFGEGGVRVLYLLPEAWTDRVLPLELSPAPKSVVRVMVGRAELFTRAQESQVAEWIADYTSGNTTWAVASLRSLDLGRFLEPAVTRSAQLVRAARMGVQLSCRSLPVEDGAHRELPSDEEWLGQIARLKQDLSASIATRPLALGR
ncbi:MAG: hypothetical protein AB7O66_07085 [Limisphaerales bacterium]